MSRADWLKNRAILPIAIILLILAAVLIFANFCLFPSKSASENDTLIATLKEFNSMTTYAEVKSILGVPAQTSGLSRSDDGMISQRREWIINSGRIYIVFQQEYEASPQRVVNVKYIDNIGQELYYFKLLKD